MNRNECQLRNAELFLPEVSRFNLLWQRLKKLKHSVLKRISITILTIKMRRRKWKLLKQQISENKNSEEFKIGDLVIVRSRKEIEATFDQKNKLKGCAFMKEMVPYCGTEHRIFKKVGRFMDERDYLIKKTNGIYLLENVYCNGASDFGPCDRSCFFFWRQEWLEKLS